MCRPAAAATTLSARLSARCTTPTTIALATRGHSRKPAASCGNATGSHRTPRNLPALTCLSQGFVIRHDKIDKEDSMDEQETELAQAVPSLIDQVKELIDEGQLVLDRLQNLIERCKALRTAIL